MSKQKQQVTVFAFKNLPVCIIWLEADGKRIRQEEVIFKDEIWLQPEKGNNDEHRE